MSEEDKTPSHICRYCNAEVTRPDKGCYAAPYPNLRDLLDEVVGLKDYENLTDILGNHLGKTIRSIITESDKADKELDILHDLIQSLYEIDSAVPKIKDALEKISKIHRKNRSLTNQ